MNICEVENCNREMKSKNRCSAHYLRLLRKNKDLDSPIGHRYHGLKKTPTHTSWSMMKNRCTNSRSPTYKYYGGKGVTLCKEWYSFRNFLKDMGERPPNTSIGRIDSEKGYSKNNCRWETKAQQSRSRNYCKLNLKKAFEIRRLFRKGWTQKEIGKKFKVGTSTIQCVTAGKTWRL